MPEASSNKFQNSSEQVPEMLQNRSNKKQKKVQKNAFQNYSLKKYQKRSEPIPKKVHKSSENVPKPIKHSSEKFPKTCFKIMKNFRNKIQQSSKTFPTEVQQHARNTIRHKCKTWMGSEIYCQFYVWKPFSTVRTDFPRWDTIPTVRDHFPRWRIISHGVISFLPSLQTPINEGGGLRPGAPFGRPSFVNILVDGSLAATRKSHNGKSFPTVENGFTPWEMVSHRRKLFPIVFPYPLDPIYLTLPHFTEETSPSLLHMTTH